MQGPVRVLYVNGGALDYGGVTTVMLNYAKHFDPEKVQVDFLVHGMEPGPREAEAKALGAEVIHVPYKVPHYFGNRAALLRAFSQGGYHVVHAHMDGMNGYILPLAKKAGVPVRVSHSHNTRFLTTNPVRVWMHRRAAGRIEQAATAMLACSPAAGRFLYGTGAMAAGRVTVMPNAMELERYAFDREKRRAVREKYALRDGFVIGHIGRFDYQKNQAFLLPVLQRLLTQVPDARLVLVGDGADRPSAEAQAARLGVREAVVFPGFVADVPGMLSAFDAFALPSRFEGLGIVLVEAQASGLTCLASEAVPRETKVTDCRYLSLEDPTAWAKALQQIAAAPKGEHARRIVDMDAFVEAGYDIKSEAEKLQRMYLELVK